jgi:glycine/D-amino acid oxidase-like deaminating enzyme
MGAGFYGSFAACEIKEEYPGLDVVVAEKEENPFTKASSTNQGQFHMGYMYSADPELARECVENIDRFSATFGDAVDGEAKSLYGIHEGSQISAEDYVTFCKRLGLPLEEISRPADIFGDDITAAFSSAEKTFNSAKIQAILLEKMDRLGVRLLTGFEADHVAETAGGLQVVGDSGSIAAKHVFNATFAEMNELHDRSGLSRMPLRYDTFLHFVLDLPEEYRNTAATVIRGPYASLLPSSFRQGHVLASGAHRRVESTTFEKPSETISPENAAAVYERALSEATTYLPLLGLARARGYTLGTRAAYFNPGTGDYTSKAIVANNYGGLQNYHAILGGKVSCMFDITETLKATLA